jgi:hypothetical protein
MAETPQQLKPITVVTRNNNLQHCSNYELRSIKSTKKQNDY